MNLNFRKGILLLLALFSSQAFAALKCQHPMLTCQHALRDYFYVGATLGAVGLMDRESTSNPIRDVHYLSASGGLAGILLGFDMYVMDNFTFGLEGFFNRTNVSVSDNQNFTPQTSYIAKMRYNTGLRILPGYEFTPDTKGHLILAWSIGNFKIDDNGNYGIVNDIFSKSGIQMGVGAETALAKHIALRGDTIYTFYPSNATNASTASVPSSSQIYANRFSTLEADLSIVYKV